MSEHMDYIDDPLIIISGDTDSRQYKIEITAIDPSGNHPAKFGIILSDLLDHIVQAYHNVTGTDKRVIRDQVGGAFLAEEQFKKSPPGEP